MKRKLMLAAMVATMSLGLVFCGVGQVFAKVNGQCAECHTMHNSQDGGNMAFDADGNSTATPNSKLLIKATCLGCHTGTNTDNGTDTTVATNNTPYVFSTTANYGADETGTDGDTLAGGNFRWVAEGTDAFGHNVENVADIDGTLSSPPGFNDDFNLNGDIAAGTWTATDRLTCAGTNGCHGQHETTGNVEITDDFLAVAGGHHGDDSTIDGTTVVKSYRFLYGIKGKEDSDWEYHPSASAHNQYYGIDRGSDTIAGFDKGTISYFCAECHGNFHSGADALGASATDTSITSPWIRHPTDFDMDNASTAEYNSYNGGSGADNAYSVVAPVASADVSSVLALVSPDGGKADDTIVTCISCHRAHGTPYADLLRWDYSAISAGSGAGNKGCFICHTSKD